jgi:hypothetical protein
MTSHKRPRAESYLVDTPPEPVLDPMTVEDVVSMVASLKPGSTKKTPPVRVEDLQAPDGISMIPVSSPDTGFVIRIGKHTIFFSNDGVDMEGPTNATTLRLCHQLRQVVPIEQPSTEPETPINVPPADSAVGKWIRKQYIADIRGELGSDKLQRLMAFPEVAPACAYWTAMLTAHDPAAFDIIRATAPDELEELVAMLP